MARLDALEINANEALRVVPVTLTVRVKGLHWLELRLWLASQICRLAAKLLGCEWELRDR